MTDKDLHSIQTQATSSFLLKMGFNRHYPRVVCYGPLEFGGLTFCDLVVCYGPLEFGGLTFCDLFTEQGVLRIGNASTVTGIY